MSELLPGETEFDRVERQHSAIVATLNDTPVRYTIGPAEEIGMFESIGGPEATRLLEIGHLAAVGKALEPSATEQELGINPRHPR